jgi:membrane protein DedA with SNARE-associated domain
MLEQITDVVVTFVSDNKAWAAPIVFALAFGESLAFLSLFIPATTILVALSAVLGAGGVEFVPLWIAATVGSFLGYWISYWVGAYYKNDIRKLWPFRNNPAMLARGEALFAKYGTYGVFVGHFFGPVRAVIPVVAGMLLMKQVPFQIANILASALWSAGVLAPNLLVTHWSAIKATLGPIAAPIGRIFGMP